VAASRFLAVSALLLAGCVTMDATECGGANWYELGFRDAMYGLQPMDVAYGEQCGKHGAKPDTAAYAKGWQEGKWEFDSRKRMGGTD
jgi:hypothetical protein